MLLILIPARNILVNIISASACQIAATAILILGSTAIVMLKKREIWAKENWPIKKLCITYIAMVTLLGLTMEEIIRGQVSSLALIMPILTVLALSTINIRSVLSTKLLRTISAIHLIGYILNIGGISFGRIYTSTIGLFRFSSFYGATTVSGLWSITLAVLIITSPYKPKKVDYILTALLIILAQFSFQRSVMAGTVLTVALTLITIALKWVLSKRKLLKKSAITGTLLIIILSTAVATSFPATRESSIKIIERLTTYSDSSQDKRNNRHIAYMRLYQRSPMIDKVTGIYPAIGNSGAFLNTDYEPRERLYLLNPESYSIKLLIERGSIGLTMFSAIAILPITKYARKITRMHCKISSSTILLGSFYATLVVVLLNLQYLDTPLGSLLFGIIYTDLTTNR